MEYALVLGTMIPKEELIKKLKIAVEAYEANKSEDNWNSICFSASLVMIKHQTKGDIKEASKLDKEMNDFERSKMFIPGHN